MPCIHPSIHVRTVQSQNVKCSPGPAKSRVKGVFTCSGAGVQPNDAGQGRWSWEVHEWLFMSQQRPTGCHSDSMNRKWLWVNIEGLGKHRFKHFVSAHICQSATQLGEWPVCLVERQEVLVTISFTRTRFFRFSQVAMDQELETQDIEGGWT